MEKPNDNISALQLMTLLFLSELFWLTSWPHPMKNPLTAAVGVLFVTAILFLMLLTMEKRDITAALNRRGVRLLLWATFTLLAAETAFRLLTVLSLLMDGMFDPLIAVLLLLGALAFLSGSGIEALSRASLIITFFAVISMALLSVGAVDQGKIIHLVPPERGIDSAWSLFPMGSTIGAELVLYPILSTRVKKKKPHLYRWFLLAGAAAGVLLFLLAALVLGNLSARSTYPIYALCKTTDLTALSELSPVFWFLLVSSAGIRMGISFTLATELWPLERMKRSARQWCENGLLMVILIAAHFAGGRNNWMAPVLFGMLLLSWGALLWSGKGEVKQ